MPNIVPFESLKNTLGIGASQVAAILHLDPWKSAWDLWREKSGRIPKPPQTDAMLFGLEMERRAMDAYYRTKGIEPMQEQVCSIHPTVPFIRAVVDGWNGSLGVNVKVPTSENVIALAEAGRVPRHYQLQLACEMECFGVEAWDYCVYDAPGDECYIIPVLMDDVWEVESPAEPSTGYLEFKGTCLGDFWRETAMPEIERFFEHLESGEEWGAGEPTPMPDIHEWQDACVAYRELKKSAAEIEEEATLQRAKLKLMMGNRSMISLAGFKATEQAIKPSFGIKISVDSKERVAQVLEAIKPLENSDGVQKIDEANRDESRRFVVKPLTGKQVMNG